MKNNFETRGNQVVIFLNRRDGNIIETIIDVDDLNRAQEFEGTWYAAWAPNVKSFYVYGRFVTEKNKKTTLSLHRFIMDTPHGLQVDHENHDTLNNTRKNLKNVSRSVNGQNRNGLDKRNTSGFRGVSCQKGGQKWRAKINVNGKTIRLGSFINLQEAATVAHNARASMMPGYLLERDG